ncbi:5-formyltetrahydrofolate cyclo-ligase [Blattabacterium cuenoti]|uniref:5-formyltetrahydrofolate cyclo-ligase n=1 Tax=Blattabacterium cuenoti TaxID=1653831 RepID=UPI00163B97D9|nr:5-formyltetrahydrofolate cyclo-ligase [Blattabacterium cuenoti]
MNNKEFMRKKYFFCRKHFSKTKILFNSHKIFMQLKKLMIWNKTYYHIYLPIKTNNEIDTFTIINFLIKKKKIVTIPYSNFDTKCIENCLFNHKIAKNTKKNKYGIIEPIKKIILPNDFIEVIFIPLIIFDLKGYRIGYGKGFYDKFIQLCRNNIIKIGLSIFPPIRNIQSLHKNDLRLDIGITPNKIFFLTKKYFKNIPYNNYKHYT